MICNNQVCILRTFNMLSRNGTDTSDALWLKLLSFIILNLNVIPLLKHEHNSTRLIVYENSFNQHHSEGELSTRGRIFWSRYDSVLSDIEDDGKRMKWKTTWTLQRLYEFCIWKCDMKLFKPRINKESYPIDVHFSTSRNVKLIIQCTKPILGA